MSVAISVSEAAVRRIAEVLKDEAPGAFLRVAVNGGGCSGFQYSFSLDQQVNDDDVLVEREGARVVVDELSLNYLGGGELDYVDDLIGAAFRMNNPNATANCGCGVSFSI